MSIGKTLSRALVLMLNLALVLSCCPNFMSFAATAKTGLVNVSEDFEEISTYKMAYQI